MTEQKLDAEEAALDAAYNAGEFVSDFSAQRAKEIQEMAQLQKAASTFVSPPPRPYGKPSPQNVGR